MAMLAAPQPFLSCLTNGTSSHTPDDSAAPARAQAQSPSTSHWTAMRGIWISTNCDNNQDQCGDRNQNDDQIAVTESPGGKVSLRFVGAGSELRQFLVVQL